jgi:hypothetical protein
MVRASVGGDRLLGQLAEITDHEEEHDTGQQTSVSRADSKRRGRYDGDVACHDHSWGPRPELPELPRNMGQRAELDEKGSGDGYDDRPPIA